MPNSYYYQRNHRVSEPIGLLQTKRGEQGEKRIKYIVLSKIIIQLFWCSSDCDSNKEQLQLSPGLLFDSVGGSELTEPQTGSRQTDPNKRQKKKKKK